jgi:hypothetical protein
MNASRVGFLHKKDVPPSVADEDDPNARDKAAQALLRKMLAAGISRYDPDAPGSARSCGEIVGITYR